MLHRSGSGLGMVLALVATATAQTVWNVPPGPGPVLANAVAAAASGDILVLSPGWYEPFTLTRGVTIRGNGAIIGLQSTALLSPQLRIALPSSEMASLDGIDLSQEYTPYGNLGCGVAVLSGSVRIENCVLARSGLAALSVSDATVVVENSSIQAWGGLVQRPALEATNAEVTLRDCTVVGTDSALHVVLGISLPPSDAIVVSSTNLHAERCVVLGGDHVQSSFPAPGARALVANQSSVWLADCTVDGGSSINGAGGTGLVNNGAVPIATANTQVAGGLPGGAPSTGAVASGAALLRLGMSQPWVRGQVSLLGLQGVANSAHALRLAFDAKPAVIPEVVEPVFATNGVWVTAGVLDANGQATFAVAVPNLPSLQHAAVWCQAFSGPPLPLHASTVAGGIVR